ncbi:ribonuclease H family protein [Novipirellula artificiosorum]|uniref:Ribonuclease HI n=1 Tax=Novipirellula artificiosorum TaxID=2528016 RepID=A0A5C6DG69_9BACT|nr:ribonuclease HI [Novipirellula artificiosorum]TWU35175.1 Ribonuclease HI [Novipirellula artificiosorum]
MLHSSLQPDNTGADDDCLFGDDVISEYLLVCEARCVSLTDGYWTFSLETADGTPVFSARDEEHGDLNRLTLLAAVRGLEAIEGASSVTLLSNNRYLIRSLADSLPRWRENNFVWEHFGRRIDVQHADLWRRIDRALQIHRVEACLVSSRLVSPVRRDDSFSKTFSDEGRQFRIDSPHSAVPAPGGRRRSLHTTDPASRTDTMGPAATKQPSDRLRQWLLGGGGSNAVAAPVRRRLSTTELLEMT